MKRNMYLLLIVIGVVAGWFLHRYFAYRQDPIRIIEHGVRTKAVIQHEKDVTVWYEACPEVPGFNPRLFMLWPATLNYEVSISNAQLSVNGGALEIETGPIQIDKPSIANNLIESIPKRTFFNFSDEDRLINNEIRKTSSIANHIAARYLADGADIRASVSDKVREFITDISDALQVQYDTVIVRVAEGDVLESPLPPLELCRGTPFRLNGSELSEAPSVGGGPGLEFAAKAVGLALRSP